MKTTPAALATFRKLHGLEVRADECGLTDRQVRELVRGGYLRNGNRQGHATWQDTGLDHDQAQTERGIRQAIELAKRYAA